MKYTNKCGGSPNLLYTVNDRSNQNSAYIKKSHVNTENCHDIEKIISQQCIQIEFVEEIVELFPAGLLHHCFHIRSPRLRRRRRRKMERRGRDRGERDKKAEQKEDTELCTSQAFVDCSTICTMLLLLNVGYVLFQIKLRRVVSFFSFQ